MCLILSACAQPTTVNVGHSAGFNTKLLMAKTGNMSNIYRGSSTQPPTNVTRPAQLPSTDPTNTGFHGYTQILRQCFIFPHNRQRSLNFQRAPRSHSQNHVRVIFYQTKIEIRFRIKI